VLKWRIIAYVLGLILEGLSTNAAIKRWAGKFGVNVHAIRKIIG